MNPKVRIGTTAVAALAASLSGFLGRIGTGRLDLALMAVAAVAAAAGSLTGSRLMTTKIAASHLKRVIGAVILAAAAVIIIGLAG